MKSESRIQQECFTWHWNSCPEERGLLFMNYNNPPDARTGAILKGMGLVAGVADMTYLAPSGVAVFLEFKADAGRQSPRQVEWEARVRARGALYFVIRSLDEFKSTLKGVNLG